MLAFNRIFIFTDEPALTTIVDDNLETITVSKSNKILLSHIFTLQSPWVSMTDRRVRYYTNRPFEECKTINKWALEIEDIITLIWDDESNTIQYIEGIDYTVELLQFWVLHTFFPLVLELAQIHHILHVSSVQVGEKVILLSAFSGGGKSTLVDYFIQKGHFIYGDDTVAIDENENKYEVIASYPFHRPYRKTEELGYPIINFSTTVQPLSHIYRLEKSASDTKIEICELTGAEKFEAIYQSMFVMFDYMKKERYLFATKMAKHIKVFKITIPWDKERLEEVYQAILIHNGV
jgi:hypothetical protein